MSTEDKDYVLGTHEAEVERLGLQHRVWRARALDAWRRAGFTIGRTVLDVGCGPGHATVDLAEMVGASGRVVAVDRSRRFLDVLQATCRRRGLGQVSALELDLETGAWPALAADGAWARWVLCFLSQPRALLERVAAALKPGAPFVIQEYFDYRAWRVAPRSPELEELVQLVMQSWRDRGGEPDIALDLPRWLVELGFEIRSLEPLLYVIRPGDYLWEWPKSFIDTGVQRLVELGALTPGRARAIHTAFAACEAAPDTLMFTPSVLEIIAVRR